MTVAILKNTSNQEIRFNDEDGCLSYQDAACSGPFTDEEWLEVVYQMDGQDVCFEWPIKQGVLVSCDNDHLSLLWQTGLFALTCSWTGNPDGIGFLLTMQIRNTGPGIVHSVKTEFQAIGIDHNGYFTLPHGAGFKVSIGLIQEDKPVFLHYPVFCSMQWLEAYNQNRGFYLGVHDQWASSKVFKAANSRDKAVLGVSFQDLDIMTGQSRVLPPVLLNSHSGDWTQGSSIYSQWFHTLFKKPAIPEWCRQMPAWAWTLCKKQYADSPEFHFDELPGHWRDFMAMGIKTMQISGYQENGHDTRFPDYQAGKEMGGEEGLIAAIQQIHAEGGKVSLYTNGRLADPLSSIREQPDWQTWCVTGRSAEQLHKMSDELRFGVANEALKVAEWDPQGIYYKSMYGQVSFGVMCPHSKDWQDFYNDKVRTVAFANQADGIYLDQVCGSWGLACYSNNHGHESPADAWAGYLTLLRDLRKTIHERNPDMYLATEGVNDILGHSIDIFQAHNWGFRFGLPAAAKPAPEIMINTLPEYLLFLGPVFKNDYRELRRAFVYGRGFDIALEDVESCEPAFIRELWFALRSRQAYCPQILDALPEILINEDDIKCFIYHLSDGTCIVLGASWAGVNSQERLAINGLHEFAGDTVNLKTPEGCGALMVNLSGELVVDNVPVMWILTKEEMDINMQG